MGVPAYPLATDEDKRKSPLVGLVNGKNVGRAGFLRRVVVLVAVEAFGRAAFHAGAHGHDLAVSSEGDGASKLVKGVRIRALDVGLLGPGVGATSEDVNGAGFIGRVAALVAVDALGGAIFVLRAHHQGVAVAAHGHAHSEPVKSIWVRGL